MQWVFHCVGFQSTEGLRGRFRWHPQEVRPARPASRARFRSLGAGRFLLRPPSMSGVGWLGTAGRENGRSAVPSRGPDCVVITTARALALVRPAVGPRFFWERTRAVRSVFPEGVLGSEKQKTHFREGRGLRRGSVAPQLFHFLARCGAFRRRYLVNLPGGDGLQAHKGSRATHMGGRSGHGVQRAVHGIRYCGKCANDVWTLSYIGTSPIFFKGCAKVFSDERNWPR